jgi:hypothetical protein
VPHWLTVLAVCSLAGAVVCALVIAVDLLCGHGQKMWIMNIVWPVTALYAGPLALAGYFAAGRRSTGKSAENTKDGHQQHPATQEPFWGSVALAATHCGSGCTLGDLAAESIVFVSPIVIFGHKMFGAWLLDFVFAYLFGILFQYFTIKPMKDLSPTQALWAAAKADTLSLASWQVGMYGLMALATFVIFGREIPQSSPVFWFVMQVAMLLGFATSYPVNWWLLRKGLKETM